jgi:hypothetical protein
MDCVVPGLEEEFSREYHEIFERPDSVLAQPGRLKYEGIFGSGYFRTMKSYYLEKLTEEERDVCRMKGVAHAVQRKMKPAQFGQSEREIDFFAAYSLRPTLAGEMTIVRTVRKNNCSINFKRRTLAVSRAAIGWSPLFSQALPSLYLAGIGAHCASRLNDDGGAEEGFRDECKSWSTLVVQRIARLCQK